MTFLSTSGILGAIGYLCFAAGTVFLLLQVIQHHSDEYLYYAILWFCLANMIHGMVDNTLYSKSTMRLYFAMWGIAGCKRKVQ